MGGYFFMEKSIAGSNALENAKYHAWFHHRGSDGWITVAKKLNNGHFKQYHYRADDLASQLTEWIGEDVYFSQNTFYKPFRRIENVRQLRSLYVDVDFYLLNHSLDWVIGNIDLLVSDRVIPDPNIMIFSGRGIVLIWLIEPTPYQGLPLWQTIQDTFCKSLERIGADSKATDAARVFRFAGSVNSKNGEFVKAEYRHENRLTLREIQEEYLPDLKPKKKKKRGRPKKVKQLFNTYTLHHSRLHDLLKIVELRNYDVYGSREMVCFLYRYWLCCYLSDSGQALQQTLFLNAQFKYPLPEDEVERATKSAEKAWKAKSNEEANRIAVERGYPGAGYNLKNKTIISWLDITPDEQMHLKTIIGAPEKRRRKRERDKVYQKEKRREKGSIDRIAYIEQEHNKTELQVEKLKSLLQQNPDAKPTEIAKEMGITRQHVYRLKKKIKV